MKTIQEIKSEIQKHTEIANSEAPIVEAKLLKKTLSAHKREVSAVKKHVKFLRSVLVYLESEPRPDFIKQEIDRLMTKIRLIDSNCTLEKAKFTEAVYRAMRKDYDKTNGVPTIKNQLKTLKFIYAQ